MNKQVEIASLIVAIIVGVVLIISYINNNQQNKENQKILQEENNQSLNAIQKSNKLQEEANDLNKPNNLKRRIEGYEKEILECKYQLKAAQKLLNKNNLSETENILNSNIETCINVKVQEEVKPNASVKSAPYSINILIIINLILLLLIILFSAMIKVEKK